jgi:hypothetical protein
MWSLDRGLFESWKDSQQFEYQLQLQRSTFGTRESHLIANAAESCLAFERKFVGRIYWYLAFLSCLFLTLVGILIYATLLLHGLRRQNRTSSVPAVPPAEDKKVSRFP